MFILKYVLLEINKLIENAMALLKDVICTLKRIKKRRENNRSLINDDWYEHLLLGN